MGNTTMGVKLDDATRERINAAAQRLDRTPQWLLKQAIYTFLDKIETRDDPLGVFDEANSDDQEQAPRAADASQSQPFLDFAENVLPQTILRAAITAAWRRPEPQCVAMLHQQAQVSDQQHDAIGQLAYQLASKLREQKRASGKSGLIQQLLQEFSLSSQEGIALMCLAEALLRIPDKATRDALIRDKISKGDWQAHLGHSTSLFVNGATWGLLFTGRLIAPHNESNMAGSLNNILSKGGEPLIRKAVDMAMRMMGEQFVTGETIEQALTYARKQEKKGFRFSYDMLGEAALTTKDAERYFSDYRQAIHSIGKASNGRGIYEGPGISIKLSALHPRYQRSQHQRVLTELYPRLLELTLLARHYDIGLNIDAEEADRLELSLDLLEKLCTHPQLAGWNGIGFVIQAYQKRCPLLIDYLADLAQRSQRRLMIRLVKGAYWDSEIKRTQLDGLEDYPVYTRKVHTDISYLACARKLLALPNLIYPQFATHNAHTLAAVYHLAGNNYYPGQYEFQCLHGMGEALYQHVVGATTEGKLNRPCRIYAPVGSHETLLAYLVRRLLENGANTSFVNRIADKSLPLEQLIADPIHIANTLAAQEGQLGLPHPHIPLPRHLYGSQRLNAIGLDLANEQRLASLSCSLLNSATPLQALAHIDGSPCTGELLEIVDPANNHEIVGKVHMATPLEVEKALIASEQGASIWFATPVKQRATLLLHTAELMENQLPTLVGILVREAGKTFANAVSEVREAVDFLRYYASQGRQLFSDDAYQPLGPVVCISPWNFPLAIFTGQIAAALLAGNSVLAKPAEQTPLIAAKAVELFYQAGIPGNVLQFLPGKGETVGTQLVNDSRIRGVLFTGSLPVAQLLQQALAQRVAPNGSPIVLIAETGGLNAMIVDSSALTEQVVNDIIASAFDSAGQRCSALRIVCIQQECAEKTLEMLRAAMGEYRLASPQRLSTDIGPLIDAQAKAQVEQHIQSMRDKGHGVFQATYLDAQDQRDAQQGHFVAPTLIELEHINQLEQEIFGPVLHVVRYARTELPQLVRQINQAGYGLTLGVHSRIDETINTITQLAKAGNQYVNRNMVGAVVGVQPFGGEGLSGTGPKAGGPLYLYRLLSQHPRQATSQLMQFCHSRADSITKAPHPAQQAWQALAQWQSPRLHATLPQLCQQYADDSLSGIQCTLPGPTGELNHYRLLPRQRVLAISNDPQDTLTQLAALCAVGCRILWERSNWRQELWRTLPEAVQQRIDIVDNWQESPVYFDAVIYHGDADMLCELNKQLAQRGGPIIPLLGFAHGEDNLPLERLLLERTVSINTAAAGGNAHLMMMTGD